MTAVNPRTAYATRITGARQPTKERETTTEHPEKRGAENRNEFNVSQVLAVASVGVGGA